MLYFLQPPPRHAALDPAAPVFLEPQPVPTEVECFGPQPRRDLRVVLQVKTRVRIARLVEWLTLGAGVLGCMYGGSPPDSARMTVWS